MDSCVFAGPADVVTLVEACLDQHLLLAAAGVDQNVGFEVHYQGMAANPENEGGDEFHQQQLRDIAAAELRLQERERKVKAREDRVEAREAELDLLLEAARAERIQRVQDGDADGDSSDGDSGDDSDGGDEIVRDVGVGCSFDEDGEEMGQDSSLGDGGEEGGDSEDAGEEDGESVSVSANPAPSHSQPDTNNVTPTAPVTSSSGPDPPTTASSSDPVHTCEPLFRTGRPIEWNHLHCTGWGDLGIHRNENPTIGPVLLRHFRSREMFGPDRLPDLPCFNHPRGQCFDHFPPLNIYNHWSQIGLRMALVRVIRGRGGAEAPSRNRGRSSSGPFIRKFNDPYPCLHRRPPDDDHSAGP